MSSFFEILLLSRVAVSDISVPIGPPFPSIANAFFLRPLVVPPWRWRLRSGRAFQWSLRGGYRMYDSFLQSFDKCFFSLPQALVFFEFFSMTLPVHHFLAFFSVSVVV